jgi:hypothetical protein
MIWFHFCPETVIHRKARTQRRNFFILPLRGRQNKIIVVQNRSAAGLKLFDFRPLTGNQKISLDAPSCPAIAFGEGGSPSEGGSRSLPVPPKLIATADGLSE